MIGAIAGDIIGSIYEGSPCRDPSFPLFSPASRFTDDTVLTVATAHALLDGLSFADAYRRYGRAYPDVGYGASFIHWIFQEKGRAYNSWGNGSAMRVSPVGWAHESPDDTLAQAKASAEVTHNHPEGVKGAQAVAVAIYLARNGVPRNEIRSDLSRRFGYDLNRRSDVIRNNYRFDVSCQGSVPEALVCFFDSSSFEDAVRRAVLLGGDADTQACIAGAVAEAFYGGVPEPIVQSVRVRLPSALLEVVDRFDALKRQPDPSRRRGAL